MPCITRIEARPLDVALKAPFTISGARLDAVSNVAVRLELAGGVSGWGEIPILPTVTPEDQATALAAARRAGAEWIGKEALRWRPLLGALSATLAGAPTVRAGLEMSLLDALARSHGMPLFEYFGGASVSVETDITIPICDPAQAEALASEYRARGFTTLKTKVGGDVDGDIERVRAIRAGHPGCRLILDANEGYDAEQTLAVLCTLRRLGMEPALLEQPVPREDWEGQARVAREAGVPVAADESCRSAEDAARIARDGLAQVINIKLAKCGVAQALEIIAIARASGLGLMIGGMVETRLAMGFSVHLAAGTGAFQWIDLDTPLLLAEDPVRGGYTVNGPRYELGHISAGHGGELTAR
ncbi:MAG: dipeptide epimerase [Deltaproteobacteria bacterium]|nr:dipeptide epimerase [Deltaproteobacteria bacterium]